MKMELKQFNMLAPFSMVEKDAEVIGDEKTITISGYANFCGKDSSGKTYVDLAGDVVSVDGIDVSIWATNPVILLNHNREQVIGKGTSVEKRPDGLYIECEVHKDAMDEKDWYRIKSGLLCHYSIGFRTLDAQYKEMDGKEVYYITKSLLLENSCVTIPANSMSAFHRVKSLEDGTFTSNIEEKFNEEQNQNQDNGETAMTNIKVKRADLLSDAELEQFKSLGGDVESELEVSLSAFVKTLVQREVAEIIAAKEKEDKEAAEKAAQELADKEAAEKAAQELADKEAELKALEDELSEYKALIETLKTAIAEEN